MKPATIDIILDGKLFGRRVWHNVPRVGDVMMLRQGDKFATVRRVVWAETGRDAAIYDCWVQLICDSTTVIKANL